MKKNKIYAKLMIVFLVLSFQLNAQTWQNITYSTNGLSSNIITTLSADKQGTIWISTADSGFSNLKSGQFRTWRDKDKLNYSCTNAGINGSGGISRMLKDSLNNLYFTSSGNYSGLVKYDSIFHFIRSTYNFGIYPLAIDKIGNIWCRTSDGTFGGNGVVKYSPNGVWQNYTSMNSGLYRDIVNDITVDTYGNVWFGYYGSGNLSRFNGISWKLYMDYDNSTSSVYNLKSDNNGDVYGYVASVLIQYKRNLDTLIRRDDDPGDGSSPIGVDINNKVWTTRGDYANNNIKLFKNSSTTNWTTYNLTGLNLEVNSIYFDNLNTAWLTGYWGFNSFISNKGLVRYNGSAFNLYTKENAGLLNNQTNDVIKGRNINQLIISHNDGISILDTLQKTSKVYSAFNSGLSYDAYTDVFIDSKNNKWIPSSFGVQKLLSNNIDWVYYSNDSLKYFDNYYATNICEDKLGNIWLLKNYDGVSMISANKILNFEKTQISQNTSSLVKIAADKNGNVFVSYSDGEIVKYNGTTWSVFTKNINSSSNLLTIDSLGNIWTDSYIFPYRGLSKYNGTSWTNYNSPISQFSPTNIFCDRYNRIWLCFIDSGVTCFDGQVWKTYNKTNSNILSNNVSSIYVDSLGKVWFGTDKGVSVLTPAPASIATITTINISNITKTAATSGGNIQDNGGVLISARGVCWSTSSNPTITNSKTNDGTGSGIFTSNITSLLPNTLYYVRAYATNSVGTAYGNQVSFTSGSTSINQKIKEATYISIFPNPNNGKMFLKGDINKNDLIEINAMNIMGDCIKIKYNLVDNGLLELNIPENITGIINLEITINGKSTFEKVSIIK